MDKSKQAGAATGVGSGGNVGAPPNGMRAEAGLRRAKLKLAGVIAAVVVVLAGLGIGAYALLRKTSTVKPAVITNDNSKAPSQFSAYTADQKAQYYLGQKNYPAAEAVYKDELKTAKTDADKSQVYISLATVGLNMSDYAQAYQYALQADGLAHSYQTASLAAYAAQQNGDKQNAAKYYQLAIDRLDKNTAGYNYILSGLQDSLKEVSS